MLVVDESHVTLPQIRAMYAGDRSRKEMLVEHGFRLPSAFDNRPLTFDEFQSQIKQAIYVSATLPSTNWNMPIRLWSRLSARQLLDPKIEIRPIKGQIDDLLTEINKVTAAGERTLVTTLTKRMAEDLTDYLKTAGVRVRYLHSEIATIERGAIIDDLRSGKFDVLVGINLLREGLDLPEVSLIAILDADKEGFLRSETSLIQTIAARPATPTALCSCTQMRSRPAWSAPSWRPSAAAPFRTPTIKNTASRPKPSSKPSATGLKSA